MLTELTGVQNFEVTTAAKLGMSWLILENDNGLRICKLSGSKQFTIPKPNRWAVNTSGNYMLYKTGDSLMMLCIANQKKKLLSRHCGESFKFDNSGTRFAFTEKNDSTITIKWSNTVTAMPQSIMCPQSTGISCEYQIADEISGFGQEGKCIYFKIKPVPRKDFRDKKRITEKVDVWSYKDAAFQSFQLESIKHSGAKTYAAVKSIDTASAIIVLESENKKLIGNLGGKFAIIKYNDNEEQGNELPGYYRPEWAPKFQLIRLRDGKLVRELPQLAFLSPNDKYVTWYDGRTRSHWCYDIEHDTELELTRGIPADFGNKPQDAANYANGRSWWIRKGQTTLLAMDQNDIWQLDPSGKRKPFNLTNGYGKRNHLIIRPLINVSLQSSETTDEIRLVALNEDDLQNGFFSKKIGTHGDPMKLTMDKALYSWALYDVPDMIKSKNAEAYILPKQTASQSPNLFVSYDLKSFRQITFFNTEKNYNWLTSELIEFVQNDGAKGKAIVYKPENFDPAKKYPVIFHYYQRRSVELHKYPTPELKNGSLDIAWYVSNGYVVCVPDILNYKPGHIAKTATNTVESAAKFMIGYPWVDGAKLGLQGHSFGAFETNFIIANSTMFAAAQSSAGLSDMISFYGDTRFGEKANYQHVESGQPNMQTTPWERPDLYFENSPVLKADKISTPLLLQHNINDGSLWRQGLELFAALRRLKKKVWMLQYDDQGHNLTGDEALDYNTRQMQFFDHYLKDKPAPVWMTRGIPAKDKGVRSGLELDAADIKP